jgi:RNA recognition motif-containing protein
MTYLKSFDYTPIRAKLLYNPDGRSKGTGFVQMADAQEAQDCIAKLGNQIFAGRKLIINEANNQRSSGSNQVSC